MLSPDLQLALNAALGEAKVRERANMDPFSLPSISTTGAQKSE